MSIQRKKPRPLTRQEKPLRDARLFVIATEDTHAPTQYFRLMKNPKIKVLVLPTEGGLSGPDHVLKRLDDFRDEYQHLDEDEFWLMLDVDHWTEPNHVQGFTRVCTEASQKGYQLAHSNPCFEVWLLIHLVPVDQAERFPRCADVIARLKSDELLGEYSKKTIDPLHFPSESIGLAVQRAEQLDINPDDRWPQSTGTHVYKLVKKLLS